MGNARDCRKVSKVFGLSLWLYSHFSLNTELSLPFGGGSDVECRSMVNNPSPTENRTASESSLSLLAWAQSDLGRKAFRTLKASGGSEVVWLEVVGLKSAEDKTVSQLLGRLGDLGFQPGEPISILGHAPLGEPLFVEIRETVLALRSEESSYIIVRTPEAGGR